MGPPKRPNNAEKHGMDGRVTPRAIAYAAVQVRNSLRFDAQLTGPLPQLHFSLTDATHWMSQYNGFNYEEFWEFIVDYFEADETAEAREASTNFSSGGTSMILINLIIFPSPLFLISYSPEKSSRGPMPLALRLRCQHCGHPSRLYDNNARLPVHLTRPNG